MDQPKDKDPKVSRLNLHPRSTWNQCQIVRVEVSVSIAREVESDLPSIRNAMLVIHTPVASATAGLFMFQMAALYKSHQQL
jgi:hypothetical protein